MSLPPPEPGLVIRYSYLWAREHDDGREEGIKDRLCAVVVAATNEAGKTRVTVLPVTHSSPVDLAAAVEIPYETKIRLGLDSERSWIVLEEGNEFFWPRPDLRPIPGANLETAIYGFLPPRFFNTVRARYSALVRLRGPAASPAANSRAHAISTTLPSCKVTRRSMRAARSML